MRVFVTGASGFVGHWLTDHLLHCGDQIVAPEIDITDSSALVDAIAAAEPDAIYHLAALTNVGDSWDEPQRTFEVNAVGTLNLLEAARSLRRQPIVLLVCSAEVYGRVGPDDLPLTEDSPLRPVSPYAASKVAAEYLGLQAHLAHGLPVVRVRAFNHIGPGQAPNFVVSSLARQIAEVELSGGGVVHVGNLSPRRDFTDVRDVVRAYRLLVERAPAGEVYNVCSGEAVAVEEIARILLDLAGSDLRIDVDPDRVRAVDIPVLCGDNTKLVRATGWRPVHPLEGTLSEVLDSWRRELATGNVAPR